MFCWVQLILKPFCSLLDSTCIILIVRRLRTALDFTLRFSFIPFRSALLQLLFSALLVSMIFGLLPAPLVLLLSLPLQRGGGGSASGHGSGNDGTSLRAARFVPWPCSFPDSWRGLDNHLKFSWLSAKATSYSSTVGWPFGVGSVLYLFFLVGFLGICLVFCLFMCLFFFSVQKKRQPVIRTIK